MGSGARLASRAFCPTTATTGITAIMAAAAITPAAVPAFQADIMIPASATTPAVVDRTQALLQIPPTAEALPYLRAAAQLPAAAAAATLAAEHAAAVELRLPAAAVAADVPAKIATILFREPGAPSCAPVLLHIRSTIRSLQSRDGTVLRLISDCARSPAPRLSTQRHCPHASLTHHN